MRRLTAATAQTVPDGLAMTAGAVGALAVTALVALVVGALVSILSTRPLSRGGKLLWVLVVLHLPLLGAAAWFTVGRGGPLNSLLGLVRRGRHEELGDGEHVRDDSAGRRFVGDEHLTRPRGGDGAAIGDAADTSGNGHGGYRRNAFTSTHVEPVLSGVNGARGRPAANGRIRAPRARSPE